jgi:hypothetical protein
VLLPQKETHFAEPLLLVGFTLGIQAHPGAHWDRHGDLGIWKVIRILFERLRTILIDCLTVSNSCQKSFRFCLNVFLRERVLLLNGSIKHLQLLKLYTKLENLCLNFYEMFIIKKYVSSRLQFRFNSVTTHTYIFK